MPAEDYPSKQLYRYGQVARNAQMLLVIDPPEPGDILHPDHLNARKEIAGQALSFLDEVQEGMATTDFTAFTDQDPSYIAYLVVKKAPDAVSNTLIAKLLGESIEEPKLVDVNPDAVRAARFAFTASVLMREVKVPFFQVPGLRTMVVAPQNVREFSDVIGVVRNVSEQVKGAEYFKTVQKNDWRVAFAFWESSRQLSTTIYQPHTPLG